MLSTRTQVHVIFDDSASMYFNSGSMSRSSSFMRAAREEFDALANRLESPDISFVFHLFSDTVRTGRRLMQLPTLSRGTNIAIGFQAMEQSIKKMPCEHAIVIFVSDGADSEESRRKRADLRPLPCKSTLLTVAVGGGFPTSIVVDELRVKYHTFGGDSVPLVFPLANEADPGMLSNIRWVVSEIEDLVKSRGVLQEFSVEELQRMEDIDVDTIFRQCKLWYNACTIKCMSRQSDIPLLEKIELVKKTKEMFNQAEDLMKLTTVGRLKPLPSNLRAKRPIFMLSSLREKLNTLLEQLNKGRLFDELSDVEKQEYLSFGNISGRFLSTSIKYNAANFETSKASLIRFVKNFTSSKEDEALEDQINMCSWAEYMEDAKKSVDFFGDMRSLAGVLDSLPFIGRTVELHPIPDCAQINPWVNSIKSMPMTLKTITTHDLYIQYKGEMDVRGERVNALIICGGHASCPGIFCHLQTFALTKNWLLYFNDSRLAAASMMVVYVLGSGIGGGWREEELARVRSICDLHTPINSKWWHDYLDCLKTSDFRRCLVTESSKLEKWMTCPGLGKFLLGMWFLADSGYTFTDLLDRFQAVAVEFLGRCRLSAEAFFSYEFIQTQFERGADKRPDLEALYAVMPALKASHLTAKGVSRLIQSVLQARIKEIVTAAQTKGVVHFKVEELLKIAHFDLTLHNVKCFFSEILEIVRSKNLKRLDGSKLQTYMQQVLFGDQCDWQKVVNLFGLSSSAPSSGECDECYHCDGKIEEVLMRSLMIATSHKTSFDRSYPTSFVDATRENILNGMAGRIAGKSSMDIRQKITSDAMKQVMSYVHLQHIGLPRPIPREHVLRYKEETGLDIDETWKVDPETRLSPISCCFPGCDHYLTIPSGDEAKQRHTIRDHLGLCCVNWIPGLHRIVARNLSLPTSNIISILKSGTALGDPFLPREVVRRLANGVGVYNGVPRQFESAERYREHSLEIARKAMAYKVDFAIKRFTKGESIVLYHAIDDIRVSYDAKVWSYSTFKKTFDAKYKIIRSSP